VWWAEMELVVRRGVSRRWIARCYRGAGRVYKDWQRVVVRARSTCRPSAMAAAHASPPSAESTCLA
jgi:hypothetical protein